MECIGNPAFSKVAGFREYSWTNMEGQVSCHVKLISQKLEKLADILYRLSIYNSKNWLYYK